MATVHCRYCDEHVEYETWNQHLESHMPDVAISYYVGVPTLMYKTKVPSGYYYETFKPQPPADLLKRALEQAQAGRVRNGFFPINKDLEDFVQKNRTPAGRG